MSNAGPGDFGATAARAAEAAARTAMRAHAAAPEDAKAGISVAGAQNKTDVALAFQAEALAAAAAAVEASASAGEAALDGIGSRKDEWKECRSTIDRFDKLLVDLRKTGFGFITALVGAATFIFGQSPPLTKILILFILVLLIITLYLVDRVHQIWLDSTVTYALELEKELGYHLTTRLGARFKGEEATVLGLWLYFILLITTCAIFWASLSEGIWGGHHVTVYATAVAGVGIMLWAHWRWSADPK
jgi:hypothetical protein